MYIKLDLKIFLFGLIFLATNSLKLYAILMLFAILHEFAHLLMGVILGFKPDSISIMPYGLKLNFKVNCMEYNKKIEKGNVISIKKILIALAGPFANLIFAFICYVLIEMANNCGVNGVVVTKTMNEFFRAVCNIITKENLEQILYCNLLIMLFNMIPIYPLDGAKILKELLHIKYGLRKSMEIIQDISWISISVITATVSIMILYFKNLNLLLALIYLWIMALKYEKQFEIKERIYKVLEKDKTETIGKIKQKNTREVLQKQ